MGAMGETVSVFDMLLKKFLFTSTDSFSSLFLGVETTDRYCLPSVCKPSIFNQKPPVSSLYSFKWILKTTLCLFEVIIIHGVPVNQEISMSKPPSTRRFTNSQILT